MPRFEYNYSAEQLELIRGQSQGEPIVFNPIDGHYIKMSVFSEAGNYINSFYSNFDSSNTPIIYSPTDSNQESWVDWTTDGDPQVKIYKDNYNNFYTKPSDTLKFNQEISEGNYRLFFDFLHNPFFTYNFFISEISPSRKEIRLLIRDELNNLIDAANSSLDLNGILTQGGIYYYDFILGITQARNIPIVNYIIDESTDPNLASLVLKLNAPLPQNINSYDTVSIEQEIYITQYEYIWYITADFIEAGEGVGLERGGFLEFEMDDEESDTFQVRADLTGSLTDSSIESFIFSGSDLNLNIDYNNFENHVFFGSAASKLENFKTKVSEIEGYLTDLSSSLSGSTVSITGDSIAKKSTRKVLFGKIQSVVDTFSSYEKFLYYDQQSETPASAPGLGANLIPLSSPVNLGQLSASGDMDGIKMVYKHSTDMSPSTGSKVNLFADKYYVEKSPLFNYSGSVYLSFLLKGHDSIAKNSELTSFGLNWENRNINYQIDDSTNAPLPELAFHSSSILEPSITGSEWRRFIYVASQSYWRPTGSAVNEFGEGSTNSMTSWVSASEEDRQYEILNTDEQIGSASNFPTGSSYPIILSGDFYPTLGTAITGSSVPFTGSLMPAGELFRIYWYNDTNSSAVTSSFITDVKVTKNNPIEALPFSHMYKTVSTSWGSWYTGLYTSASAYDDGNIHSFVNNLPLKIQEDSEADDLKTFLNMFGEYYDLIRNYIDNYLTFYNRRYKKLESTPTNLLPILAENFGWETISPYTGSLSQFFGSSEADIEANEKTIETIVYNTWRKIINNLIYVYKTKGTHESVKAILNIYGYPPDILTLNEYGGSTQEHNPAIISNEVSKLLQGVGGSTQNVSFVKSDSELYSYIFNNNKGRIFNFDWWINEATDLNTIEFIFKAHKSLRDQIVFESSGSGAEKLWDLRLVTSGSNSKRGKLEFRLNNSKTGSLAIASNAVSMSTDYLSLKGQGKLWNAMLQRVSSSISGSGIQEYKMYIGLQDGDKIKEFAAASMSISGGIAQDSNHYANQNWLSTGSLNSAVSGNLYVGTTYTGSLAEIRAWTTTLSASKFKQHILNKKSTVGNNIEASRNEITYRFALQENWKSGSASPKIKDSNLSNVKDYTFNIDSNLLTGSVLYDKDSIEIVKFSIRIGGTDQLNTNKIIINPEINEPVVNNLNPQTVSHRTIYEKSSQSKRVSSNKVSMVRSPQKILNDFIIDSLGDFDVSGKFGDPQDLRESYYEDLNTFRDTFFNHYNIEIDINEWINSQRQIFNKSLIKDLRNTLPARTTAESNIGILFEPTLLERNKIKSYKTIIETGPAIGDIPTVEHDMIQYFNLDETIYDEYKININDIEISSDISLADTIYESSNDIEYDVINNITHEMVYESTSDMEYNVIDNVVKEMAYESSNDIECDVINNITHEMAYESTINANEAYINSQSLASHINLADSWGTSSDDTHFLNLAWSGSGNVADDVWQNVNYFEQDYIFQMIGDMEMVSSSFSANVGNLHTDWSDTKFFLNREIRDKGKGFIYKSYVKAGNNVDGPQDGRPVGKTAYFATRSDGEILYPSNHYIKFSEDPMRDNFINGYKNVGGSYLQNTAQTWEDVSTASFYSVTVTGDDSLVVLRGKPNLKGTRINRS